MRNASCPAPAGARSRVPLLLPHALGVDSVPGPWRPLPSLPRRTSSTLPAMPARRDRDAGRARRRAARVAHDAGRRAARRRGGRQGPPVRRSGGPAVARRARRGGHRRRRRLRHQRRQALQLRAARQAAHPQDAGAARNRGLPRRGSSGARGGAPGGDRRARRDGARRRHGQAHDHRRRSRNAGVAQRRRACASWPRIIRPRCCGRPTRIVGRSSTIPGRGPAARRAGCPTDEDRHATTQARTHRLTGRAAGLRRQRVRLDRGRADLVRPARRVRRRGVQSHRYRGLVLALGRRATRAASRRRSSAAGSPVAAATTTWSSPPRSAPTWAMATSS